MTREKEKVNEAIRALWLALFDLSSVVDIDDIEEEDLDLFGTIGRHRAVQERLNENLNKR